MLSRCTSEQNVEWLLFKWKIKCWMIDLSLVRALTEIRAASNWWVYVVLQAYARAKRGRCFCGSLSNSCHGTYLGRSRRVELAVGVREADKKKRRVMEKDRWGYWDCGWDNEWTRIEVEYERCSGNFSEDSQCNGDGLDRICTNLSIFFSCVVVGHEQR